MVKHNNNSWIPYSNRTKEQRELTNSFHERISTFRNRMVASVAEPDLVILNELGKKVNGGTALPRIRQLTGSCVGVGGCRAYSLAMAGDVIHRGDNEEVKIPSPWPTYGVGRLIMGAKTKGDGSFGAAQAEACQPTGRGFGYLPSDDKRMPQPTIKDGWATWTEEIEMTWSHPSAWPIKREDLQVDASKYGITAVTKVTGTGEVTQGLAQGYSFTVASDYGMKKSVVKGDYAIGVWNDTWYHQMAISGYSKLSPSGLIYLVDNQWAESPSIHTPCPTLQKFGINGSFWMLEKDLAKIIKSRDGEVYAHSATNGFPTQQFDWTGTWVYDE